MHLEQYPAKWVLPESSWQEQEACGGVGRPLHRNKEDRAKRGAARTSNYSRFSIYFSEWFLCPSIRYGTVVLCVVKVVILFAPISIVDKKMVTLWSYFWMVLFWSLSVWPTGDFVRPIADRHYNDHFIDRLLVTIPQTFDPVCREKWLCLSWYR